MHFSAFAPSLSRMACRIFLCASRTLKDFRALLPETDFLCLHLPFTPETVGLIGEKDLRALNKEAFIINCSRGGIVDEDALARALQDGEIRGAGLDVFAHEPHDPTHPLFSQKRCLFSPHNAALTEECAVRMARLCAGNILDCIDAKLQKQFVVNWKELGM
jgi:D-3-phosphoglycerate dehydrogenase